MNVIVAMDCEALWWILTKMRIYTSIMTFKYDEFSNYIETGQSIERRLPGSITDIHSSGVWYKQQGSSLQ